MPINQPSSPPSNLPRLPKPAAVPDSTGASTGNTTLKRISLGIGVLGLTLFALASLAARKPDLKATPPVGTIAIGSTPPSDASASEANPDKLTQA